MSPIRSSTTALIFPGQGSQAPGMGKELAEAYPEAREIFAQADEILGRSISTLCFEGPAEDLQKTINTQPALYVASAAALAAFRAEGFEGAFAAGHSLGEYTALYAAGSLEFETGLRLVDARSRAMERACQNKPGAMAAIIGLDEETVSAICAEACEAGDLGVVVAANRNSPGQVALSGDEAAVDRATVLAKEKKARAAIKLKVGGAFHSPLMEEAALLLGPRIDQAEFSAPRLRFVANVTGDFVTEPAAIREGLKTQITSCVLWSESIRTMAEAGATTFVELGPGKILTGLVKRIDKSCDRVNIATPTDLAKLKA